MRGHDVHRVAAVGDDTVDLVGRAEVLAQQSDRDLRDRERVGRVDAELRRERGVRLAGPCTATCRCATADTRG